MKKQCIVIGLGIYGMNVARKLSEEGMEVFAIDKDMKFLDFDWGKAEGFNCISQEVRAKYMGMTMRDYLRYLWNNPNAGQRTSV